MNKMRSCGSCKHEDNCDQCEEGLCNFWEKKDENSESVPDKNINVSQ